MYKFPLIWNHKMVLELSAGNSRIANFVFLFMTFPIAWVIVLCCLHNSSTYSIPIVFSLMILHLHVLSQRSPYDFEEIFSGTKRNVVWNLKKSIGFPPAKKALALSFLVLPSLLSLFKIVSFQTRFYLC